MKTIPALFALVLATASAPAFAKTFTCTKPASAENGYTYTIELNDDALHIQQSSINARYAPIDHKIVRDEVAVLPDQSIEPTFVCNTGVIGANKYNATIEVYENSVLLLQSSVNARYAPVSFQFVDESSEPVDSPKWTCSSEPTGKWKYSYSIEVSPSELVVLQQSMIARYAPITEKLVARDFENTDEKPRFSCVSEEGPNGYTARIEVFAYHVDVLQSSINARYAPLSFMILAD